MRLYASSEVEFCIYSAINRTSAAASSICLPIKCLWRFLSLRCATPNLRSFVVHKTLRRLRGRTLIPKKRATRKEQLFSLVLEVGLEPTKPKGGRFTVSCDCHYTIPAHGAASRIRTEDLLFTKQLL